MARGEVAHLVYHYRRIFSGVRSFLNHYIPPPAEWGEIFVARNHKSVALHLYFLTIPYYDRESGVCPYEPDESYGGTGDIYPQQDPHPCRAAMFRQSSRESSDCDSRFGGSCSCLDAGDARQCHGSDKGYDYRRHIYRKQYDPVEPVLFLPGKQKAVREIH